MAIIKWKIGVTEVKERILNSSELESNGLRYTAISTIEIKVKHNVKNLKSIFVVSRRLRLSSAA